VETQRRHGHQAGDRLLRTAATAWRAQLRHDDVLVRLNNLLGTYI
jgi:GGDEF domain-containing protein